MPKCDQRGRGTSSARPPRADIARRLGLAPAQQVRTLRHLETHLRNDGVLVIGAHERLPEGAINFLPLPQCPYILGLRGAKQISWKNRVAARERLDERAYRPLHGVACKAAMA